MAGKAERDEKSSRKEEGRDSSYHPRIDLWTLPRHQEAKSVSPVSFLFPFAGQSPISFFLHAVCLSDSTISSLTGSLDAAQMRPQLPLFRRSLSELAAPSKSYHTLSGISINASALIARSSPYYRRAAPVLTQLLRNLSLPSLSLPPLLPFAALPRVFEEEARTSGKPKSTIWITRTIYRSCYVLVSYFPINQRYRRSLQILYLFV